MLVSNCVRKTLRTTRPANILVLPYDGLFESTLPQNHNIYALDNLAYKKYCRSIRPYNNEPVDFILCNERISQLNNARQISNQLQSPLVIIYHSYPPSGLTPLDLHILNETTEQHQKIVITDEIGKAWKFKEYDVVGYSLNDYNYRNHNRPIEVLISDTQENIENVQYLQKNIPTLQVGQNYYNHTELCLQSHIYIHLPTDYSLSIALLQAVKCGCKVITTKTPILQDFFKDNKDIYFIDYLNEIPDMLPTLLKEEHNYMALDIINGRFSDNKWNSVFDTLKDKIYERV